MTIVLKGNRRVQLMPLGWRSLGCAVLLGIQAGSANAKDAAPRVVWAKAGVSYEQYRGDALECGNKGLARNIDNSEEVKTLARASRQLESIDASAQANVSPASGAMSESIQEQRVIAAARPEQQYARIKEKMFQVVRGCMADRGYARIVLTESQREQHGRIKGDADARRAYIYKLASDPHVLETQRAVAVQ